jgi:SSS family solute:Na+ symporter
MSSLDSALNSLSASTMRDFIEPFVLGPEPDASGEDPDATAAATDRDRRVLRWSKLTTVAWGAAMVGFAFLVGGISDTVVEGINKVGSAFYGPILAAFLAGVLDRRARGPAVLAGVVAGVSLNVVLWLTLDAELYWMWWNMTGLVTATVVTFVGSRMMAPPRPEQIEHTTLRLRDIPGRERRWIPIYAVLFGYFLVILCLAVYSDEILTQLL